MSDLNNQINMNEIITIINQVEEAHTNGRINNEQYLNIIQTFKNILNLVIGNINQSNSTEMLNQYNSEINTITGGFLNKLMSGGSAAESDDSSLSTLNFDKDDSLNQSISLKGGYDYLYNPTKKNKFTPTASYHAKKSYSNTSTSFNKQIKEESESLTGGALNNYFNKLIESTLKSKKVKGGNSDEEFDGGAKKRKACKKKKKSMKGGEDESEEETEEKSEEETEKDTDEESDDETEKKPDDETEKKPDDEDPRVSQDSDIEIDKIIDDEEDDPKPYDPDDDILEGGKSQLQPYHDKIVENITKYLNKYEPELEGEDKEIKGKQIKRLLNVLYYKSDENTSMEDRIKQLEDIGDKTNTEAKLKKIITSNKTELDSIIDSWVKAEPKKKNKKNKKTKVFSDTKEESIEIKNKKNKKDTSENNSESSINGNIVDTASMIDSVIMGGKKSTLKRNLFNY